MQTTDGKEEWKQAIEKARALYEEGRKEVAKALELAKEKGQEALDIAQEKGREAWEEAKVSGSHAWKEAREKGEETWEDAEKLIRKYPSRAIGLSLLVGVIVGALIARDRD